MTTIPTGVGWTALLTAYGRAQEAEEKEPRFRDLLAVEAVREVVGVSGDIHAPLPRLGPARDDGSSPLWDMFRFYFAQRTIFYDRHILEAVRAGCRQVVLLGAGMDSRAHRLGLPPTVTVFEVDTAPVLDFKQAVLDRHGRRPTCGRVPLVADVTAPLAAPLYGAGLDTSQPVLWVAEGLLMYLSRGAADRLLSETAELSPPGSRLLSEYFPRPWTHTDVRYDALDDAERAAVDLLTETFQYGPAGEAPADWSAARGWHATEVTTVTREGREEGRTVPALFARPGANDVWMFAATRHAAD
ncbi:MULTISPECIES: SAM-dependent methyltransferase [unclassified Streptomyces]|uniref:SAM-dependent methyltransferase n=1 Tax=unclassified Streptomyces TaxID=2593676 RepID=UPI003827AE62